MVDIVWKTINSIFYVIAFIGSVYFIIQIDWKNLSSVEVLRNCGSIGGLLFIGGFFRKEAKEKSK